MDTYALNQVSAQEEYEFYDMLADPMEMTNLANATNNRTAEQLKQFEEMKLKLVAAEKARLRTLMLSWDVDLVGNACVVPSNSSVNNSFASRIEAIIRGGRGVSGDFFGGISGQPTGNGSITVTYGIDKAPNNLFVYSPIGAMNASISDAQQDKATGQWTGTAVFNVGTGVFASVDGRLAFTFNEPPASSICQNIAYAYPEYCWQDALCPGSVTLTGTLKY